MTDLQIIQEIEKEIGKPISRKSLDELKKILFGGPACALNRESEVVGLKVNGVGFRSVELIGELHGLTWLNLGDNRLTDISALKGLRGLTKLYLHGNQLTDISALKELRGLTSLDLMRNQLTDISALKELRGLTFLNLYGNQLTDISALKELRGLTKLVLGDNPLTDISALKELRGLAELYLLNSRLSTFSVVLDLPNLRFLHFMGSKVADLPEHLQNAELDDIRSFYRQKAKKTDRLYEAKVLLVGEPDAGKTSLMKKLVDPGYQVDPKKPEESTLGITVHMNWPFTYDNRDYKAHLWDFGGQQIQYYIHQFFLTEQALYILLVDDRKDYPNIDYWFRIIRLLGQESPVLVVLNQKNITAATGFDWNKYKTRYGDELYLEYESINLATEPERFDLVAGKVKQMLASLKHMGSELPASWIQIRKDVIALKERNHISRFEFKQICEKHDVVEEVDQQAICNYLHMLGILLHFRNDEQLADIVFVNAQWISNAVYMILSDKDIESKSGRFEKSLLFEKWGDRYNEEEKNKLFTLMQKREFDLIYQAQDQDGAKASYIAPLLLPDVAPVPAAQWKRKGTLSFQYCYRFMPVGIITRLIVRLNQWISGSKKGEGLVWKSGVVLEKDGCLALVKTDISKKGLSLIDISIKGESQNAKDFLSYIRGTIDEVHQQSFKHVEVELLVPCNCELCRADAEPTMFELSLLQKYLKTKRYVINCEKGESFREVPIEGLLGAIVVERPVGDKFDSDRPSYGEIERSGISTRDLFELIREAKSQPQPPVVQSQQVIVQQPPPAETTSPAIKKGKLFWAAVIGIITLIGALLKIAIDSRTLFYPDKPEPTATTRQTESISAKPAQASDEPEKSKRDAKRKSR